MKVRLEALGAAHRPLLAAFRNDEPELVLWLRRWALRHQEKDRLSRTWVAVGDDAGQDHLVGFFSLAAASLDRALVQEGPLDRLPGFPIPAVLLARLAVDDRDQGQGLGTWLFDEALLKALTLAQDGPLGLRVLITDAKNDRAATFYARRGLVPLGPADVWPQRMALDLAPLLR